MAPAEMLGGGETVDAEVLMRLMPCGLYAAEVDLPSRFLRLVSVGMAGWSRGVSRLLPPSSADWECQFSSEPGIAGCPSRPRAYIVAEGEGLRLRLLGSESADATLGWLRICTIPTPSSFHFPPLLYPRLVSTLATKLSDPPSRANLS